MEIALDIIAGIVLAFWIAVAADRRRWWPRDMALRPVPTPPDRPAEGGGQRLAVVVPARNEAPLLGRTLPALVAQADLLETLVLVDDRSEDGTGDLATRLAASTPFASRVRVVRCDPPPPGWSGKIHALDTGLRALSGPARGTGGLPEWVLFTDADILHPPGSLEGLVRHASVGGHDLVSVMVRLRTESFWERLLIPPFTYFFQMLYPFRRVSDPRSRVAAAAGGCLLLRREALEAIGGLAAVRGEVIDDVAIATRVKGTGRSCWLGTQRDMLSLRAYDRLGDIVRMVTRTAFVQLRHRWSLLFATLLGLGLLFVAPPWLALAGAVASSPLSAAFALTAWGIQSATLLPVVRHHGVPAAFAATLPASAALYGAMTAMSAWRHLRGKGPEWKGRTVGR